MPTELPIVPDLPAHDPQYVRGYELGWDHGAAYARQTDPRRQIRLTPERKMFVGVTAVMGLGATCAAVATLTKSKTWQPVFAAFGIGGLLLGAVAATLRVANGGPAPWEI